MTAVLPAWMRTVTPSRPPANRPPPLPVDRGTPRTPPPKATEPPPAAARVAWAGIESPGPVPRVREAPQPWTPGTAPAVSRETVPPVPATIAWSSPVPLAPRRSPAAAAGGTGYFPHVTYSGGCINDDPPEWAAGTGLMQSMPNGAIVVYPLSIIEPYNTIGDEGPINEAFQSSPKIELVAGRPYAFSSHVVVPDGGILVLNRAAVDRDMIILGEGAMILD